MWLPKTENEIIEVVKSGSLNETSIFDAKKEISTKSQEIAKDIASMANDGGVIIYGIGEDENKRLTILNPIPLAGQPERIDAIVRSCIAEPPQIHLTSIITEKDPSVGYLVVLIPPSERAPHMVIVNGDHRFYGRTETGNAPLNEGEVARLYTRREKTEVDRDQLLEDEIKSSPLEPSQDYAFLFLYARPVFTKEGFFNSIAKNDKNLPTICNEQIQFALQESIYKPNQISPDFRIPREWINRVDGLLGPMGYETRDPEDQPGATLNIKIDDKGSIHLFSGGAAGKQQDRMIIDHHAIAGITSRFLAFAGSLYQVAGYSGMLDVGIALTGLRNSVILTNNIRLQYTIKPCDFDKYKKTRRFSNLEVIDAPQKTAKYLVTPFFDAVSQGHLDPFKQE
jgi:hypothetical protein